MPADKVSRIKDSIHTVQQQKQATSRQLAGIAGMLSSSYGTIVLEELVQCNAARGRLGYTGDTA